MNPMLTPSRNLFLTISLATLSVLPSCSSSKFDLPDPTWVENASPLSIAYSEPIRPFFPKPTESSLTKPVAANASLSGRVTFQPGEKGGGILSLNGMEEIVAEQDTEHWCWAAGAQMVNQFNGNARRFPIFEDQAMIAEYFSTIEETTESGARFATIARALAPELEVYFATHPTSVQASIAVTTGDEIVEAMTCGEMALISIRGHVYAVLAVEYVPLLASEAKQYASQVLASGYYKDWLSSWSPAWLSEAVSKFKQADDLVAEYGIVRLDLWNPTKGEGYVTYTADDLDYLDSEGYHIDFVLSRLVALELFTGARPQLSESLLDD